MLRSLFIYLSKAAWARRIITRWPLAWRVASRFVAGEKLQDAIQVVKALNEKGIDATLDQLGEHTTTPAEAVRATHGIMEILDAIQAAQVRSNVSIKLSQIGLVLDEALCKANLRRILSYARERNNFVRIDMEDTPWTDATLRLYSDMCSEGLTNTGVVIQSYLYRSEEDVRKVAGAGGRIRLCKGAYNEPPELAFPKKRDVDENYDRLTALLVDLSLQNDAPAVSADGRVPPIPAIATHDPARIDFARAYVKKTGFPKQAVEFQMLNGIQRDLQESLAREGYPVRVYVPFGTEWYPYFTRRLAERPANVWFFVSNFFKK